MIITTRAELIIVWVAPRNDRLMPEHNKSPRQKGSRPRNKPHDFGMDAPPNSCECVTKEF